MKKFKKFFLLTAMVSLLLLCFAFGASALDASGQCGENVTYTYNSETGEVVISGTGAMKRYSSYSSPFYNSDITSVVIEEGVTSIGEGAFVECTSLTSVTIGEDVTSIGEYAFCGCTSLESVTIPDSVTSIDGGAFYKCTSLESIAIGNSVTSIGEYAFYNTAYYNTESNWVDNVLYIGNRLIEASISGSYEIKEETITIADYAFVECTSLESITIPDSVTSIGYDAFNSCTSLKSVTIPDSVTSIGGAAFYNCTSLESITISDSVTSIGEYAFTCCTSLASVTIGNGVTSIGEGAFDLCTSLTDVYYGGTEEEWNSISIGSGNSYLTDAKIYYNSVGTTAQTNKETGIIAEYDSGFFDGYVTLVVSTAQGKANIAFGDTYSKYVSYDIHFELGNETVQPNGSVTVKLPIPDGYNISSLSVYYIDDEGNATKLSSNIENGYVVFTTKHFSEYAIVDESSEITEPSTEPDEPATEPETPDEPTGDNCSHLCHKTGIMSFIWKILRFFYKLFKINPVCDCGTAHY